MEITNLNNRDKIVNSYGIKPTLPYDIEGVLVKKNNKDIVVEKTVGNKVIEYSLRLREEIKSEPGENIIIEKENIVASKVEEKEQIIREEQETRKVADIIRELGLEYTEENILMIEHLLNSGIPITKENISSYLKSKEYLNKIIEGIDADIFTKLIDRGIDIEGESLQKISEVIEEIKNEKSPFSIGRFLKIERDLNYKEAESIARDLYGQKMGKDVYDTIIALHKEKMPITKENIDKTIELMSKLSNLKGLKDETYIRILKEDMVFTIDNLYKLNNSYTTTTIASNVSARNFENLTILKDTTIDSLKEMLLNLEIEDNTSNINILREFIISDIAMDRDSYDKVISMKEAVGELINLLRDLEIEELFNKFPNLLDEDINRLVEELKRDNSPNDKIKEFSGKQTNEIMKNLEILGSIKDSELLQLIKNGEDFTLKSIKEIIDTKEEKSLGIEQRTVDKTIHISNIFNTIGENLSLETISLTRRIYNNISLDNLYNSQKQIGEVKELITPIEGTEESLIYREYLRARNNITTNLIKDSIRNGKVLEQMPLDELNDFIDKKTNRYKNIDKSTKEIKDLEGQDKNILPIIMKNGLPMTLKEIKDINSYFNGEKGLSGLIKDIVGNQNYTEEFKEAIKLLQEKISESLKTSNDDIKYNYKELMNSLNNSNSSSDNNRDKPKEYIQMQNKLWQKDLVIQLPIEIDNEFKHLNLIVPDINKGIDKNSMSFFVSLETANLGKVNLNISINGKAVKVKIEEQGEGLSSRLNFLEEGLEKIGYSLKL